MNRLFFASIFTMAGIIVSGCDGGLLAPGREMTSEKIVQTNPPAQSHGDLMVTADPHD